MNFLTHQIVFDKKNNKNVKTCFNWAKKFRFVIVSESVVGSSLQDISHKIHYFNSKNKNLRTFL